MSYLGWFDGELRPDAWWDAELNPAGWFDTELIDTAAAAGGGYTLTCLAGSYALSGKTATLARSRALTATAGSYALSGKAATLARNKKLTATAGSYTLSGVNATLTYTPAAGYTLTALAGSYALSGKAATVSRNKALTASAGSYTLSGVNAVLKKSKLITAGVGSYALSGQIAELAYVAPGAYALTALAGSYSLTGAYAVLEISGGTTQEGDGAGGSRRTKWYVKHKKKILVFDAPEHADSYIESLKEQKPKRAITPPVQAKFEPIETIRIAPLAEQVKAFSLPFDINQLIQQQNLMEVARINLIVRELQDEEDIELLLIA